jgi:hypothetical protein
MAKSKATKKLKKSKKIQPTKPLTKISWSGSAGGSDTPTE